MQKTIEQLRNAGINIWMLTGDKVETACCIAISAGLKNRTQKFKEIKDMDYDEIKMSLENDFIQILNTIIVIDGAALDIILKNTELEQSFFEVASQAPAVCVCRCSPTQKATIVQKMKELTGLRAASVGDGGNDVAMIQEADVGIGIVGKEGMQASLAADFSID